jgi:PhnB protein
MAERELTDRLDEIVDILLTRPEAAQVPAAPELAALWRIAVDLVDRPHEGFRSRLAADLDRRAQTMTATIATPHVPQGLTSLMPYVIVREADRFIDFARQAFGAEVRALHREAEPDGPIVHGVIGIGDSVLELSDGSPAWPARPAAFHLYVPDADAAYARATGAGATTLLGPSDRPYGDREADVRDPFGNHWYIGTRLQDGPVPAGMHTLTPTLHVQGTDRLIEFIQEAFGAEVLDRTAMPDGTVVHAQLRIGEAILELGEARGFVPSMPCSLHYYVEDVDAVYARALRAGATASGPPSDRPYGDRAVELVDPFGNNWFVATHIG